MSTPESAAAALDRPSSSPAMINVVYKAQADSNFDMDYYRNVHMPLVQKHWGPHGLKNWVVAKLPPSSGYIVQAVLWWDSIDAFFKGSASEEGKIVFGDVPKFTNIKPDIWIGGLEEAQDGFAVLG